MHHDDVTSYSCSFVDRRTGTVLLSWGRCAAIRFYKDDTILVGGVPYKVLGPPVIVYDDETGVLSHTYEVEAT